MDLEIEKKKILRWLDLIKKDLKSIYLIKKTYLTFGLNIKM